MLSVRGSLEFRGDGPFSLSTLAQMQRKQPPISLRSLIDIQSQSWSVPVTSGDVTATVTFSIRSVGDWWVKASVHDDGDISGDSFLLGLQLVGIPGNVGAEFSGELDKGQTTDYQANGIDPLVREHYHEITGIRAHLEVNPDVSGVISGVVTALIAAGAAIFFGSPGTSEPEPCPDDGPFHDDQKKCVQWRKVGTGGTPDTGDSIGG